MTILEFTNPALSLLYRYAPKMGWIGRGLLVGASVLCVLAPLAAQNPGPTDRHVQSVPEQGDAKEWVLAPQSVATPMPATPAVRTGLQTVGQDYVVSPEDDLDIHVLDVPELSREYRVSPAGFIRVPLLAKPIPAAGLTLTRLSEVIAEQLRAAGMVEHPDVSIEVKQSRLHAVSVTGAVRTPVVYPILAKTTLLDALSQAGGLADDAGSIAIVSRGPAALGVASQQAQGSELQTAEDSAPADSITVNLRRLLENGDTAQNVVLYPGDKVIVPRAGILYVVGAVNRAGGFVMKDDPEAMTVLKALGLAGNLGPYAASKNAVIVRRSTDGTSQEIPINLHQILERKAPDQKLLANDILFIPDSASKRALHTVGAAAMQAGVIIAGGLAVYH